MAVRNFSHLLERHYVAVIQHDVQRDYRLSLTLSDKNLIFTLFDITLSSKLLWTLRNNHILSRPWETTIVKIPNYHRMLLQSV